MGTIRRLYQHHLSGLLYLVLYISIGKYVFKIINFASQSLHIFL